MNTRQVIAAIRAELERYRRLYRQAEAMHREAPALPDRRDRWAGAIAALERVLDRIIRDQPQA